MSTLAATLESVKSTLRSIIVGADTLRAALKVLSSVAPPSVLGGKLARTFIACFDRQVWVGAQAGAVKMMVRVERAHAPEDGLHCIPWDRTNAIAKAIDPKDDIRVTFDDGEVVTFASDQRNGLRSTFNLATARADGIALPSVAGSGSWSLPADALVLALDSAKVAMGGTRFNTDGVLLRATESGDVSVLATDGCQLAISTIQTFIDGPTGEAFIPSEAVKALRSVALNEGDGLVSISMRTENVKVPVCKAESGRMDVTTLSVRADGIILEITCGSVSFPDLAAITSTTYDAQATFGNMAELVKACSGLVKVAEPDSDGRKMIEIRSAGGRDGRITLSVGDTSVVVPNSSTYGKPFARSLDSALLLPYLKAVPKSGELILDAVSAPGEEPQEHCVRFHSAAGRHYIVPQIADKPKDATEPVKARRSRAERIAEASPVAEAVAEPVAAPAEPVKVEPVAEPATIPTRWQDLKPGDRIVSPMFGTLTFTTATRWWDGCIAIFTEEKGGANGQHILSRPDNMIAVLAPSPVAEPIATEPTRPASVKVAAMAPEAAPDTYTPIRPVAESAPATPENVGHAETAPVVEPKPIPADTGKSDGHLAFYGTYEYFEFNGKVLSAPIGNPVMPDGYRCGRFECQAWAWPKHSDHLRTTFGIPSVIETAAVSGGSPVAELPTIEIKGAAYTVEPVVASIILTKLVNGERHEVTWAENGVADCSCPAFYHTGSCKHADYALKAGLIPTPAPVPVLPEPPADPCDIRPGHPEYTIEDEHARVRAIIVGAPILVYHLPESGPRRVDTLGWVVADHVSRLVEIQRDGQHGRDDSAGVGWTASLLWGAMPTEERDIFAEWVDAIGYDPTEDFAGLPAEEQWDVFAGCCITGTPIRTIPPGSDPGPGADATIFGGPRGFAEALSPSGGDRGFLAGGGLGFSGAHDGIPVAEGQDINPPAASGRADNGGRVHADSQGVGPRKLAVRVDDRTRPGLAGSAAGIRRGSDAPEVREPGRLAAVDGGGSGEASPRPMPTVAAVERRALHPGPAGRLPGGLPAVSATGRDACPISLDLPVLPCGVHWSAIDLVGAHAMNTLPALSGGSPEGGCRRCAECAGLTHHWLDNPDFGSDDPTADNRTDVTHVCKHCEAVGNECEECQGTGIDMNAEDEDEDDGDFEQDCYACDGEGVILVPCPGIDDTPPPISGGSDEASPGPKHASPGSIVLFWHCSACRKSGPVGAALPAARPEVSARAIQDHRTDSPDCPGVPDVGFPAWMPEDGTPGTIYLPVGGGSPDLPEDYPCPDCGGTGTSSAASTKASRSAWRNLIHLAESPDCPGESCLSLRSRLPVSGGSPELPEDCPCPECNGTGVGEVNLVDEGEEQWPCEICEGTGRYSPTELPEEEYDRLVAAATPSNETLRRMIRDRKPPEASDTLLDDLERLARQMQGDRPTQFEDSVALAMRKAYLEIRRLRWEIGQLQAKP